MAKTVVLYVFHEYNERVRSFFQDCIFKDASVDFMVISNKKNIVLDVPEYVKTLHRDNIGYDFGGWSDALLTDNLYENYDKYIFVNSSVIGPFVPSYYEGRWTDIYLNGLKNNVKLFGSTINTCGKPLTVSHVQSYIFAMDRPTLKYLIDCGIFSMKNYETNFQDCIFQREVLMSRKIIENDWNIGSLQPYYKDVDFTFRSEKPREIQNESLFLDDVMYPQFRNSVWNEYELVFIKGNRVSLQKPNKINKKNVVVSHTIL